MFNSISSPAEISDLETIINLRHADRIDDAKISCRELILRRPHFTEAHYIFGCLCVEGEDYEAAAAAFGEAARLRPEFVGAHYNRAVALTEIGEDEDALESYENVLRIAPEHKGALLNLGAALNNLGRPAEALKAAEDALSRIEFPRLRENQGLFLRALNRNQEACAAFQRADELSPNDAHILSNLAFALVALLLYEDALCVAQRAYACNPNSPIARQSLGLALRHCGRPEEAIDFHQAALQLTPEDPACYECLGLSLLEVERFDEALQAFHKAIELGRFTDKARHNRSMCLLLLGKYQEGWSLYESRFAVNQSPLSATLNLTWRASEDLTGKRLLVVAEQGLGDTIMTYRYVRLAQERGAEVVMAGRSKLRRALQHGNPPVTWIDEDAALPPFDMACPSMSLPAAFGATAPDKIYAPRKYLWPEPDLVEVWRRRLGEHGFKIGVAWQGSLCAADFGRSAPLRAFQPLALIPGARLISLQMGAGAEQLSNLPDEMTVETPGETFDSGPDAFVDSCAVIANLDLVVTTDTSLAHLGGALGCPTWIALRRVPDWRWLLDREDSPWYPSVRLFRQRRRGDWSGVFEDIRVALAQRVGDRA